MQKKMSSGNILKALGHLNLKRTGVMTQILKITNYLSEYSLCALFANTSPPLFSEPEDSSQSAQAPSCLLLTIKRSARQ